MCLRVTGPLTAMKRPSSEPVSTMVPALQRDLGEDVVAQVAQHAAGVGQLGAAQVDLVDPDEFEDLLPAGDEARAQHAVHAEGLGGRGGRRGGVVRRVGKLLAQLQIVQDEPVAVVGNAQAVGGLAVGGGGKVGADPGRQPRARVRALRKLRPVQRAQRGVNPVEVAAPVRREETVGQADLVDGEPCRCSDSPRSTSKSLSEPATLLRLST